MKSYPRINRILHVLFGTMMVFQLISEELMKRPKLVDGAPRVRSDEQVLFFDLHEWFGITLLIIVALRLSLLLGNPEEVQRLFPFVSVERMRGLIVELKEIPSWFAGKLRPPSDDDHISGLVHGLGLLLGLVLGLTGTSRVVGMDPVNGTMDEFVHAMKETHEVLGELLWYYVIGHVAMALVHQLKGHRSLQRISPFSKE